MSKKITLENVDSSELPEIPVIGEVKQVRFTQDMELVSTLADSDLFMVQAGADLEARPNTITFDLIIKNLSGPIEEGSKKFVTGDEMFKVIGDITLLDTWNNDNIVSSLNATYVNVRRIEEGLRREVNRSTAMDEKHDEQIANLRQDLTATNEMLNNEIKRSMDKDKEHDGLLEGLRDDVDSTSAKLDAEIDRSTAKDAEHDTLLKGLRVDVNANKSAIESEVSRSTARDEAHDAAIAKNASDISNEVTRAKAEEAKIRQEMKAADTTLQNAITAETERATGVEEDLQQQITDLSGSTDDRLEALEALSHEQNTDTGTTSKTFVIDSGNTGAMLKAEGGGLSTRTKGDAGYANFTVNNLVIKGDVTQEGDTFITRAERVEVRDNMILINEGERGAGVTAGFAGIEVDRGTEQNFMFGFNESDGMFKIGKEGNMFDVALRQPVEDMTDGMFASWDAATKTFKTTNVIPYNRSLDFKFNPEIADATIKIKFGEGGLELSMDEDDDILSFIPSVVLDEVKYSLISTNTNGIILGDYSGSNNDFILDIKKSSFISPVLDKNVIIGGKNAYFSYYSHRMGSPNTITASCDVKAPSFYRESDNAEVMYATDPSTLTDGMFLSWDADNKKVVTTNKVPYGGKLYLAFDDVYITQDGRSIEFHTNDYWWRANTSSSNTMFSSSSGWFDFSGNIIVNNKVQTTASTLRLETAGKCLSIGNNGTSTLDTTLKANTFYRFSDSSEVLYQVDLKSVLTGKETNYAPTVKAVSDAIDAVNTGTSNTLKNYLKLSGGTMTGSIRIVDAGTSSTLMGILTSDGSRALLFTYLKRSESRWGVGTKEDVGVIRSNLSNLIHLVNNDDVLKEYIIHDTRNLPDPATKSGNNAFTGANTFVANNFSVGNFKVDISSNLAVNLPYVEGLQGWSRSLYFKYNNLETTRITFGAFGGSTTANYAFIGLGEVDYSTVQYKFFDNRIKVPDNFGLITDKGYGIVNFLRNEYANDMLFGSNEWGVILRSNDTDINHLKKGTIYKIWDASNLPTPASTSDIPDVSDMARRSEANTFTAKNTFTAGQFNVGSFSVNNLGSLTVDIGNNSGTWSRYLRFMSGDNSKGAAYGAYSSSDNTINYAWIGIGDVGYSNAQYIFAPAEMKVPIEWSLSDANGNSLVWSQSATLANLGRATGTTKIRSGAVDLIHTKGTTDYKILDESNYTQYLPTENKWTYGFVITTPEATKVDFNTVFAGHDSPKILFNYNHPLGADTNAPSDMMYGAVLQVDGNYNSSSNNVALRPQLAFDVNHGVENGTRYMWFRTANNLGFGGSSNWKRVVTADENVAALSYDENTYPTIMRIDGTTYNWLRVPNQGLLPNTKATLDSGGISYLGTKDWAFGYATIHTIYSKRYMFGDTGVDFRLDTNNKIAATISGSARGIEIGDLLVSSNYNADAVKVPTNGIFSSGRIQSNTAMLVGYSTNITNGQLGYGLYYAGTMGAGMGSEYSTGALVLYKFVNPNIGKAGYNVPYAATGTPTYLKIHAGNLIFGIGAVKAYTAGEEVTMTEYPVATQSWANGAFYPLVGKGHLSFDSVGRPVISNNQGYSARDKDGVAREILWVSTENKLVLGNTSTNTALSDIVFRYGENNTLAVSTIASQSWVNTKLGSYLPLTGGTLTGQTIISSESHSPLVLNYVPSGGTDCYMTFRLEGVSSGAVGFLKNKGTYLYNYNSNKYLFLRDDGAYFGTTGSDVKLSTLTDLANYLPLTGGTVAGSLIISAPTSANNPLALDNKSSTGSEIYIQYKMLGDPKAAFGFHPDRGGYIYNYKASKGLYVKSDGVYFGQISSQEKLLTSADMSGYLLKTGGTMTGAITLNNRRNNVVVDVIGGAGNSWNEGAAALSVQVPSDSGQTPLLMARRSGADINTTTASERLFSMELLDTGNTFQMYMAGSSAMRLNLSTQDCIIWGKQIATQEWVSGKGYLTSITKSMVTTALGYTPPTTNTTYSQATSSTLGLVKIGASSLGTKEYAVALNSSGQMYVSVPWTDTNTTYSAATSSAYGLVKIGATGLASKNYAVQLNSSGQMYVAVPWTDTNTTYAQATSSALGLVKIGATGLESKNYAVQLNSSGQMYVAVPWTDTNTHYTTRLYAGASGTAANSATTSPYIKVTDDNTYRNQIRLLGGGATSVSSDASGNITITSTNTTYGAATTSQAGLMAPAHVVKLNHAIEYVDDTDHVHTIQVVDTIPAESSQAEGVLYLRFA